jgi:thiol:disulfide interchange protein DsbD
MRKIYFFTFFLLILSAVTQVTAQENQPVQFAFKGYRVNDTSGRISIRAIIKSPFHLFSMKMRKADDPFISSISLDSSSYLSAEPIEEKGKATKINDAEGNGPFTAYGDSVEFIIPVRISPDSVRIKGSFNWLGLQNTEYPSGAESFGVSIPAATAAVGSANSGAAEEQGLWGIFLVCLGTGLLAMITPCVFPLIPVTVSFFLKRSKTRAEGLRNAVSYSLSIIAIYTIPTLILTLVFGDKILYTLSTHPITNLLFFAFFVVFAISFFGAFELTLPNSWANKADEKAGKGGLSGIFFMALTLVIVSFSCTGPLVGTLLGETSTKGVSAAPIIGMLGFGIGLAIPFSIFAFFPSMLQSLPKSGGWLNSVKVTFGFIELALALKFLSNVDLTYHWGLLNRDVFLTLWIVIFILMGLYLIGKLKFSHDSDLPYISVPRLFFAIGSFAFAVYMIPGLWGAPLKLLSGFIPPSTTQEFNLDDLKYKIGANTIALPSGNANTSAAKPPVKYIDKLHVPFGLTAYFDMEEGMAAAKALNKPVMIDFTGHTCANCRKMEEQVWKDPAVLKRLKEDFVLVSLYVDEYSIELPEQEHYKDKNGKLITTVGDKNLDYEITKFGFNAQPLYMFLDLAGEPLSDYKYGYESGVQKFIDHLDKVKAEFAKRNP